MKEDLPYSLLPFEQGREGTSQLLRVASALCLGGYKGIQRLHMQFFTSGFQIFLYLVHYHHSFKGILLGLFTVVGFFCFALIHRYVNVPILLQKLMKETLGACFLPSISVYLFACYQQENKLLSDTSFSFFLVLFLCCVPY